MTNSVQDKVNEYKEIIKKIKAYNEAVNVMYWDLRTGAPKNAVEGRSEVIGMLSSEAFQLSTSTKMNELLEFLLDSQHLLELDEVILKSLKETKKDYDRSKKIPSKTYQDYVVLISKAESVWEEAKEKSDYNLFKPYLEQIIKYNQDFTELLGYEGDRYNALLDQYEPGITVEQLDPIFKDLRDALVPLIQKVSKAKPINTKFLKKHFDSDRQRKFSLYLLEQMGYDFQSGRLDTTVHPFQITLNHGDVRVTTKFDDNDITVGLFSTLHEGGHAQYEQNISKNLAGTDLATGTSMGIHESQSRFWENIVGLSLEYWDHYYQELVALFPEQLNDVSKVDFYRAVNEMKQSLIRIDADELTYNLHIMIRYEIEKDLINGRINAEDLPTIWNEKMKDYFGVVPKNDAEGVLQDVHWAGGLFGYFPTYSLGNIYSAQFYNKMKEDLPNVNEMLQNGNLIPVKSWLNEKIHQYGKLKTANELLNEVTGEDLNAKYLIDYLTQKVKDIYQI